MKLTIFTICLDAMPMITWHLPVFNRLHLDWQWVIAEGAAANVRCTSWCKPIAPRLSMDGTTEYLNTLRTHPRVKVLRKQLWDGKVEMCNACLAEVKEPGVLLQVDADELWDSWQVERIVNLFRNEKISYMRFDCVYYVGQNIITTTPNAYGHNPGEWVRAWRISPGDKFDSHEPPALHRKEDQVLWATTALEGLIFHHYAYAFAQQVAFKEAYYGYKNATEHWRRLQNNKTWPVKLKEFLPWTDDRAEADVQFK